MSVLERIKDLVKYKKLTQKELSELIGKSEQTINNYFVSRTKIDIETLQDIAKVLNVPVAYFFEEENKNGSNINYQVIKGDNNNQNTLKDKFTYENESLRKEIESQKKEIALLREMIEMLKKK